MRTLDEVIDLMEYEARYNSGESRELDADVLLYLKLYRSDKAQWEIDREAYETARRTAREAYEAARDKYLAAIKELNDKHNRPLTWEELRSMEGKPVWIEWASEVDEGDCDLESADCVYKYWCFVYRFRGKDGQIIEVLDSESDWHQFYEERLGTSWNAYRKEK